MKKPSNYTSHPWSSIAGKSEAEQIARNIMIILKRTGNEFRELNWEEYKEERLKDGEFTSSEKIYFDEYSYIAQSAENADRFCKNWYKN